MNICSNDDNRFGLKNLVVKLERCDKIWKTLQLIRNMHEDLGDIGGCIKREPVEPEETITKQPPMIFIPDKTLPLNLIGEPNLPYIKYQPIFNSFDESFPQFKLEEKSRVHLYHCEVCSQEYCDYRRFTKHQEIVHGIVVSKKVVSKKEKSQSKDSYSKPRRNSTGSNSAQFVKKLVADENVDLETIVKTRSPPNDSFKCKLCDKSYKNIKKHMVDYHKIKCFEVLGKVTDQNSNIEKNKSPLEIESFDSNLLKGVEKTLEKSDQMISQDYKFSTQNNNNVLKRRLTMPNIGLRKKLHTVSSQELESDVGTKGRTWECKTCDKKYVKYDSFRKHERKNHFDRYKLQMQAKKRGNDPKNKAYEQTCVKSIQNNVKGKDIDHRVPLTRSSLTKIGSSSDKLETGDAILLGHRRENRKSQIVCVCGRSFRTRAILSEHKLGCKFISTTDTCKSNDTRTAVDRDSGISITIKKKNNSYEIVSKEGSDEEVSRNGHRIEEPEISEETSDSSSDNSDSSEFDDQLCNVISEKSKYSVSHRVMILELADEDVDVDIEEVTSIGNSLTAPKLEENKNSLKNQNGVPTLKDLCKRYFIEQGKLPKQEASWRCKTCKIFLGSKEKLSKHIERHKKLMKRSCSCGLKFSAMKAFDDHIANKHPTCIVCPYCKEKYASIVGLREHSCLVSQGAPYIEIFNEHHPCPNCNIAFNTITWLQSHMRSKHLDPTLPFQCYQCLEKFPNEIARSLHAHKKHNRESVCSVCNQKFQSVKTKQKHEAYHRGVGFPCHSCRKTYRSKRNYLNHAATVHSNFSNDKLKCSICQESIKTKSFKKHILRHKSILECEMCDKVLYDFRNLERHIMDCHGNENYPRKKCNVCGVSFPTKEQLEAHVTVEKFVRNERYKDA